MLFLLPTRTDYSSTTSGRHPDPSSFRTSKWGPTVMVPNPRHRSGKYGFLFLCAIYAPHDGRTYCIGPGRRSSLYLMFRTSPFPFCPSFAVGPGALVLVPSMKQVSMAPCSFASCMLPTMAERVALVRVVTCYSTSHFGLHPFCLASRLL